jgi:hypothetical protein
MVIMIERLGQYLYDFEEKHPIIANIIGIGIIYLLGILITIIVSQKRNINTNTQLTKISQD